MQRVLANLGRTSAPFAVAAPLAVAAHPQPPHQAQNAGASCPTAPTGLSVEEHEGFLHIGFEDPIVRDEVALALTDLSALGTGTIVARRPPASAAAPGPAPALAPVIEEVDDESVASDGSEVNGLLASADNLEPAFQGAAPPGGSSAMDLLTTTVTNLLNNEDILVRIRDHLASDPAFNELMDRFNPHPSLPAPARVLLLEELETEPARVSEQMPAGNTQDGGNPLLSLLAGIQRGVAVAATHVGEAFCHLGNMLRGIGESLSLTLAGMDAPHATQGVNGQHHRPNVPVAAAKVACAVAIMVLTRRVAVARLAL